MTEPGSTSASSTAMDTATAYAGMTTDASKGTTAVVLWWRGRVPASVARLSIGLFVIVFLQAGLGYRKVYWLHVPIGVGIFGGLTRQLTRLDALWRTAGVRQ